MADYPGPPTPGWALRANRVRQPDRAAEYDERARAYRARRAAEAARILAREARR